MNLTYTQLLKGNRNFRNLFWGQLVSELGNWFNFIAGLGLVRAVSGASPVAAAIFVVCRTLPFAVLMPFAGTFVDRFSRRQVMIISDLVRVFVALTFLLVTTPENLWIAYLGTILLSAGGAFFEAAKNAATPNISGKEGLFAGTALMFSSRFLLMAVGSALGGWAAAVFGYQVAFIINAISFAVSALSVWLIPEEATREDVGARKQRDSFFSEMKEGIYYFWRDPFVMTIILMNIIWATGGGAINLVFERLGGVSFAQRENWNPDLAVSLLWFASGIGLSVGMLIAHRVNAVVERKNATVGFIGWSLIIHGLLFSVAGIMPSLWWVAFFTLISRAIVGVEYAVQETMLQRALPDYIRGRILTIDRGAEITVFSLSGYFAGLSQYYISPEMLTIISGVLSASAGVLWFMRKAKSSAGDSRNVPVEA